MRTLIRRLGNVVLLVVCWLPIVGSGISNLRDYGIGAGTLLIWVLWAVGCSLWWAIIGGIGQFWNRKLGGVQP